MVLIKSSRMIEASCVDYMSVLLGKQKEEEEIALGLELSKVSFIWVVRFQGGDYNICTPEALSECCSERFEERGFILQRWASQAKILGHSSIGGFVSHCVWNSTVEGMIYGVPIIAMPMKHDQLFNAKLVTELGVGMKVPRENGKLKSEEIVRILNEVTVQEVGKELKARAKDVGQRLRVKGEEETNLALDQILQLNNSF
ncbi:beta-D-glucosyl crocetin beta-1,6-glucosyltransferase-like [Herrania umbratica]|uniref:Beta-D-glucosyl crocetin beta-1,6-glucosyltransferase-like n=1 Tax=Herrania umbratica TaxID=108875 RepID=A0A6J0ZUY0_9ROSI|nr:beta-D-glucosyl crocetin beta-1,6-glucosyltransferase-like [Herrania umbratica]